MQQARSKLGLSPAQIVPYLDLLQGRIDLPALLKGETPIVRFDSPGENFAVERELIALGAIDPEDDDLYPFQVPVSPPFISPKAARKLAPEKGRIYYPAQWFRGYRRLLRRVKREVEASCPNVRWMNDPDEIAVMFDKRLCHQLLSAHHIRVPRAPAAPGTIQNYEELRDAMRTARMYRVFVKLAFGSSASGILAYQMNPLTGAELADTTIGFEERGTETIFYNSSRLIRYTEPAHIRKIVNWLCTQGIHVEQWVEKAMTRDGRAFDIRQLVVDGETCHRVARLSRSPITNLHLGNKRASLDEIGLSATVIEVAEQSVKQTMSLFPASFVAGIDILIGKRSQKPYIVDINPFGDLLFHVQYNGHSTYEWEMICLSKGE